ncbi:MAG: nucleotidyltransferase domain-containing protein [Chitinispirillia bacterium]|nr:nucleotidyltransferase domain-containing protein [Chitinispirillia bacterium]MCL2267993.1 nucleotidyltransferase domain-containing protein [Chitinispirillia bacterium]
MNRKIPIFRQIVDFITSKVSPERIVLFGSYARGNYGKHSDIDILVVMKNLDNERKLTKSLYRALLNEDISTPVDIIAADYDRYNTLKDRTGLIYKTIEREGQLLYAR